MAILLEEPRVEQEQKSTIQFPGIPSVQDGLEAVGWVESHISQAACAVAEFSGGKENLWGERVLLLEPESEFSSASACEGFALAGGRVTNFTSGQGLIRMKAALHSIAGKRLPMVFHCGHEDVMGVADCGWGMLFARNAQEAADLALISRRTAEYSETPFLNVQDGFLTTHTIESLRLPEPEMMRAYIEAPSSRLRSLFDSADPMASGCVQNQKRYSRVKPALQAAMGEFAAVTGRRYDLLNLYRMEDAEYAIVGMGTMMETAAATVDTLRSQGIRVGTCAVTSFRPFPGEELARALDGLIAVTVVERTDNPLAESNPLTMELKSALVCAGLEHMPEIHSAVGGLGGSEIRPGHFTAIVQNMISVGFRSAALGVHHLDEIEMGEDPDVRPPGAFSLRGHSTGGFGSVTINKIIATAAAELFDLNAQAFARCGSEKYYLTLAPQPVRLHAELTTVDFVAVQNPQALAVSNPLDGLDEGGIVYLQSSERPENIWQSLPAAAQRIIRERRLRLYTLDAARIAKETTEEGMALLGAFLRLAPFREKAELTENELFDSLDRVLAKYFGKQGKKVNARNLAVARRGYREVAEVLSGEVRGETLNGKAPRHWESAADSGAGMLIPRGYCDRLVFAYTLGREAEIEADEFAARSLMPASSAASRSFRHLAPEAKAKLDLAVYDRGLELLHRLPETPARFINEKALGDMMLAQRSILHTGGAGTALRMMLSATEFRPRGRRGRHRHVH